VSDGYLDLADWRRQVAEIFATWRHDAQSDPERATERWRTARDELFRSHPQSPLKPDDRARFGGLSHFAYDPSYRMSAVLEPAAPVEPGTGFGGLAQIALPASVTPEFKFRLIGRVSLSGPLVGSVLPVFWMEGYAGGLFLPFRDVTSGAETYAAGRYLLDTVKGADQGGDWQRGEIVLDFNLAYHPSCAYDPKWNCPLAPPESRLTTPVPAGERLSTAH
jgi:uncharacterized protein (DUF1684 family)